MHHLFQLEQLPLFCSSGLDLLICVVNTALQQRTGRPFEITCLRPGPKTKLRNRPENKAFQNTQTISKANMDLKKDIYLEKNPKF
jgi:hypothetical protein